MKEILYYKIINSQAKENRVFEYRLDKSAVDDFVKSLPVSAYADAEKRA